MTGDEAAPDEATTAGEPSGETRAVFWLSVAFVYALLISSIGIAVHARESHSMGLVVLSFLAIGWLQYVIIQAMHEACHQVRNGWTSWLAAFGLFYAIGLTQAYRKIHFGHPLSFNTSWTRTTRRMHVFPSPEANGSGHS